jgi:hypothetical protein
MIIFEGETLIAYCLINDTVDGFSKRQILLRNIFIFKS